MNDYRLEREKTTGTYARRQPPGPVAKQVRALLATGVTLTGLSEATGVSYAALVRIVSDSPPAYVRASTVELIRDFSTDHLAPQVLVPPHGTVRRLRALVALGWTSTELAGRLGLTGEGVGLILAGPTTVRHATRVAVEKLYAELSMTVPRSRDRYRRGVITRTRARAKANGWAPPLAWEDEKLDNPKARPVARSRAA